MPKAPPIIHDVQKVRALRKAYTGHDPFCSGIRAVPSHQLLLYYTQDNTHRRINFADIRADDLNLLYQACQPAEFGRNAESILDETYRKAGKMDVSSFSTLFDPLSLGIHQKIIEGLLIGKHGVDHGVLLELYKLNVYGEGDFFRPHKDTPRSERMLGSLVVVLPTKHEGGQLMLRQDGKEWTINFADNIAAATEPSICFVAFFGDVEHEVLPVTSGHRVTLTYNIYYDNLSAETLSWVLSPFHQTMKKALVELVNDENTLPHGGYLGFGLVQEYVFDRKGLVESVGEVLKGPDRALADICVQLGLSYSVKVFYFQMFYSDTHLIADRCLMGAGEDRHYVCKEAGIDWLEEALSGLTIEQVEAVKVVGRKPRVWDCEEGLEFLGRFYRDPVTQVLEVRRMSSTHLKTPLLCFGNEPKMDYFYGKACLLVAVNPIESRQRLVE